MLYGICVTLNDASPRIRIVGVFRNDNQCISGDIVMRGAIIQYNYQEGTGLIIAEGQQFEFNIKQWRGSSAPEINKIVQLDVQENQLNFITPIPEDVLLKEKAEKIKANLGLKAGQVIQQVRQLDVAALAVRHGAAVINTIGWRVLAAYAVFIAATVVFTYVSINVDALRVTLAGSLYKLASGYDYAQSTSYLALVFLAYLSFLFPVFLNNKKSWLFLLIPFGVSLLPLAVMYVAYLNVISEMHDAANIFGGLFGGAPGSQKADAFVSKQMASFKISNILSFGVGFYASVVSGAYLGWIGVRELRSRD